LQYRRRAGDRRWISPRAGHSAVAAHTRAGRWRRRITAGDEGCGSCSQGLGYRDRSPRFPWPTTADACGAASTWVGRSDANDIVRLEFLADRGWTIVRVSARQLRYERAEMVARAGLALRRNGYG
jgi:hypothetical protein